MLKEKVIKTIKKNNLIVEGDNIVIGVSGGPDSMCLLHLLNELKKEINFSVCVAHINHMIREEAKSETEFVKEYCKKIGVECYIKYADVEKVAKNNKRGTEETGRQIRYEFFEKVSQKTKSNKIATAHNSNDKAETIIMNILRGTGTSGLKGIEASRDNKYIRPLIEIERQEIEEYCKEKCLAPQIDSSNNENIYTRNKIRNIVIPYIKEAFNPNIIKTINRLSKIVIEEDEYINKIVKSEYKRICIEANEGIIVLNLKEFNLLDNVIKRRIILYTINKALGTTKDIETINIEDIIELCSKNIGNKYLKPIKSLKVLIKNKKIFFIANEL